MKLATFRRFSKDGFFFSSTKNVFFEDETAQSGLSSSKGCWDSNHSLFPDSLSADVFNGECQYLRLGTVPKDVGFRVVAGGEIFPCQ